MKEKKLVLEIMREIIVIMASVIVCLLALGCASAILYCSGYIMLSIICGILLLGFGVFEVLWVVIKIKKVKELGA